jgi:hypothetical protein
MPRALGVQSFLGFVDQVGKGKHGRAELGCVDGVVAHSRAIELDGEPLAHVWKLEVTPATNVGSPLAEHD